MTKKPNPVGRPSDHTQEKADELCNYLSQGESLRTVCKRKNMPSGATVFKWMRENEDFLKQYEKAKQESSDAMAEDVLDIADEKGENETIVNDNGEVVSVPFKEDVQRSRLRVDTRKWLMAKMKPKKYGDSLDLTSKGDKLPAPILGGLTNKNGVSTDDSSKKDSSIEEKAEGNSGGK